MLCYGRPSGLQRPAKCNTGKSTPAVVCRAEIITETTIGRAIQGKIEISRPYSFRDQILASQRSAKACYSVDPSPVAQQFTWPLDCEASMLKRALKTTIRKLGYDLQRTSPNIRFGVDIHRDTHFLLSGKANVIIDAGANIGQSISIYKKLFPESSVYAFEPDETAFQKARLTGAQYESVVVNKIALGDFVGETAFYEYEQSAMSSLLRPGPNCSSTPRKETKVEITTLDAYCRSQEIKTIDVLKIDTQGTGDRVLRGAEGMLTENRIRIVRSELSFQGQYEGHFDPLESISWMQDRGYRLVSFYDQHHRNNALSYLNVLFRRRSL